MDARGRSCSSGPSAAAITIPMIPGLLSAQRHLIGRTDFRKGQLMEQMAQGKMTSVAETTTNNNTLKKDPSTAWANVSQETASQDRYSKTKSSKSNQVQTAEPAAAAPSTKYRTDATQPKWITHDRQVLRFFGYFQEPVVVHNDTYTAKPLPHHQQQQQQQQLQQRVRRVVVFFHLSDHSISISEPRIRNSGIPQGEFMKRTVVNTPKGGLYEPDDFRVGGHVKLQGRTIHLVDCDDATRTFFEESPRLNPQEPPRKYPDDPHKSQLDEIDAIKNKLKGKAACLEESAAEKVRKFHENSQKVLRFFVSWQDPHPLYNETRKYVLHYYLCDDTMEIVEPKSERDGRGHFAVVISRRRMASEDKRDRFLCDKDLRCGDYVHVFAKRLLLEDCDLFTRDYYLETHGVTQEKYDPEQAVRQEKPAKWKLFQANAKEIRKELDKQYTGVTVDRTVHEANHQFYQNDALENKQLRFRARFHGLRNNKPTNDPTGGDSNAQREFVLTFYLEDDTLAVFEPRVKNSGISGGRFLDRGRFRKHCDHDGGDVASREQDKTKSAYKASDFYVGAVVSFEFAPQQKLELVEADRQTLAYCESHPNRFPYSDINAVMAIITRSLGNSRGKVSGPTIRCHCRAMGGGGGESLPVSDVQRLLQRLGVAPAQELNAQQWITLCRKFEDEGGDESRGVSEAKQFLYDDFCDALALKETPTAAAKDVYTRLRKCESLRKLLRAADPQRQRGVEVSELTAVANAYKVAISSTELQEILATFQNSRRRGLVDYNSLCDRVFGESGSSSSSSGKMMAPHHQQDTHYDEDDDNDMDRYGKMMQYSLRRGGSHDDDDGNGSQISSNSDAFGGFGDDDGGGGDASSPPHTSNQPYTSSTSARAAMGPQKSYAPATAALRPASPRRQIPALPLGRVAAASNNSAMAAPRRPETSTTTSTGDARVVAVLRRVFGERKYLLRKAFRERDHSKSGFLGEESFMEAVLSLEPRLSDDDTYVIADVYFPTNNSQVDYTKLLEGAFRS